ncbi:hypothetical protein QYM36_008550 [Artemia franciscana]|uniref:Ankyrin repeat protein n=2 Tax=Artemia franciscana TaxID=6661 RepID=A0AA88IGZ5_ARTSF|nr:hypothetical protein QYM36_008550 [Artemia franciscana]
MAGSFQIDAFKKLDKEIASIAKLLSSFYRSPEIKKRFRLRKKIMDYIRQTSSLTDKLKRYQSQIETQDLDGILSSFYFQMAKLSTNIDNLEKEMEKRQQDKNTEGSQGKTDVNESMFCDLRMDVKMTNGCINPNLKDDFQKTALHYAAEESRLNICQLLVPNGTTINATDSKRMALLMTNGCINPNLKDDFQNTALHYASEESRLDICQILVSNGANVNALDSKNRTPLFYAIRQGSLDICQFLVSNGALLNLQDNFQKRALHYAAEESTLDICQVLVSNGATIDAFDSKNWTALFYAVRRGSLDICKFLVSNGALLNLKDNFQRTVLHYATNYTYLVESRLDICQVLVSNGATINALDSKNRTPLYYAARRDSLEICQFLVSNGALLNLKDNFQKTVLHIASEESRLDICQLLVSNGATINALDSKNRTPLYYAARRGTLDICQFLISNGALYYDARRRNGARFEME